MAIKFEAVEATSFMQSALGAELRRLEGEIASCEGTGIEARWRSGHAMLKLREGKKLPVSKRSELIKELGINSREINYRMQFADSCPTKNELCTAMHNYPTWNQIKLKALPRKPRTPKSDTFESVAERRLSNLRKSAKTREERLTLGKQLIAMGEELLEEGEK